VCVYANLMGVVCFVSVREVFTTQRHSSIATATTMPLRFAGLASSIVPIFAQDVFLKAKDTRPNIVWIMADDLGYGEVGLYPATSEHGRIATPNLDTFGKEGVRFTQAYAGYTVCGPSRMTFFTGRHSGQCRS